MLRVSVRTRRLRSSSGRDGVEDGREAIRRLAVERERRRQQLRDLHVVERRRHAGDDRHARPDRPALRITCMITCGSSCVAAVARWLITSGMRSGDITETMLVRWRKAARTVAACEVIIGEPSSVHFGAATAVGEIADVARAAGDREQALLRALVEDRLLSADDRQHDRAPEVVALGRLGDLAFLAREHLLVVDLLDRDRRVPFVGPDARRAAARGGARPGRASAGGGTPGSSSGGIVADEGDREDVAVVQHRRGFGDAGLRWRRPAAPSIISVSGVTPIANAGAERRVADRGARSDRPTAPTVGCSGG